MDELTFFVVQDRAGGGLHARADGVDAVQSIEAHGQDWEQLLASVRWNVRSAIADAGQWPKRIRLRVEQEMVVPLIDDRPVPVARRAGSADPHQSEAALGYFRTEPPDPRRQRERRLLVIGLALVWLPVLTFLGFCLYYLFAMDIWFW